MKVVFGFQLLTFLVLLYAFPFCTNAQVEWAYQLGDAFTDFTDEADVDNEGNLIVAGSFRGQVDIDGESLSSLYIDDIYVYKLSSEGKVLWKMLLYGPNYSGEIGVRTDAENSIYLSGSFIEYLILEGDTLLQGSKYYNTYLLKLSSDGELLWSVGVVGENETAEARGFGLLDVNDKGEVVLAMNASGTLNISGQVIQVNAPKNNLLIIKYDTNGDLLWIQQPESIVNAEAEGIAIDNQGQVYVTGFYNADITWGPITLTKSYDYSDIYIFKTDADGKPFWGKSFNKTVGDNVNNYGTGIAVNEKSGDLFVIGTFKGTVDFDGTVITGVNTSEDPGNADAFLVRMDINGNVHWAKRFGSAGHDVVLDVDLTEAGNPVVAGAVEFQSTLIQFDQDGNSTLYITFNGLGFGTSVSYFDSLYYMTGFFYSDMSGNGILLPNEGESDGYVLKINPECINVSKPASPAFKVACDEILIKNHNGTDSIIWYRDGELIEDYSMTYITEPNSAVYQVELRNRCYSRRSELITFDSLSFLPPKPLISYRCHHIEVSNNQFYTIKWYHNDILLEGERYNTLNINEAGTYRAEFWNGCGYSSAEIDVSAGEVISNFASYNVITPNGDNMNEFYIVEGAAEPVSLMVFNQWGKKVYESYDYKNNWNGAGLAPAVYYTTVQHPCIGTIKGVLTIK